ncbi:protein PSK SIMULATOR 1-like [Andrographis paniculata]|uniref:protein PSK SIMULATOR 1-like n=1 Tax=Andrographis paniculata TaxID=175694 RepID=UPI0021E84AC7|nr:protein PSK SIMULATOR 1-like [Andrographis paniculata]XP_051130249.1 protein PSK SIMULATOR 1-like [Andrographis paniculata]
MLGETLTETWFGNIWKNSRKSISWEPERPVVGIVAFEISRLMSKVVNIWHCLTDRQIVRLRQEIASSVGIRRLVSEDEDYLMDLALAEIIDNLGSAAKLVAVLGKKCADPMYHNLRGMFDDPGLIDPKWYGWQYRLKKMDRKVKKMEKFVAATEQLFSEIEILADHEQTLRRMRAGSNLGKVRLLEFQEKVVWQRQQVKNLQELSPWARSYDYIVRLLLRSLFTIVERIKYVHGVNQMDPVEGHNRSTSIDCSHLLSDTFDRLETERAPVRRSFSNLGLMDRSKSKNRTSLDRSPSSILSRKPHTKARRFAAIGMTGCVTGGIDIESPFVGSSFRSNGISPKNDVSVSFFTSKRCLLDANESTLGHAALALHYANVIILVEKFASAPHLISLDARDDLYSMLPSSIRSCLRSKLKTFSKTTDYDAAFAAEWGTAIGRILEWLSPLAHNMARWQSDRNFERRRLGFGSNVLLVHTLYFADRATTEAAIVELLMGLNYLARFGIGPEIGERRLRQPWCGGGFFPRYSNMLCDVID